MDASTQSDPAVHHEFPSCIAQENFSRFNPCCAGYFVHGVEQVLAKEQHEAPTARTALGHRHVEELAHLPRAIASTGASDSEFSNVAWLRAFF